MIHDTVYDAHAWHTDLRYITYDPFIWYMIASNLIYNMINYNMAYDGYDAYDMVT